MIWFVGFCGRSTIVGYLMLNPLYTRTLNIYMICKDILLITFLNESKLINFLNESKFINFLNKSKLINF